MAYTLNHAVQRVLEKLNLDPVNSIGDTVDSLLIAREAESTFYDILSRHDWDYQEQTIKLEASSTLLVPEDNQVNIQVASLHMPEDVVKITSLYVLHPPYPADVTDSSRPLDWKQVCYLSPKEFLENSFKYEYDATYTDTAYVIYKDKGFTFNVGRNSAPTYYTSFDDKNIVFDSIDKNVGLTVLPKYVMALGYVQPSWELSDSFEIPLPAKLFPMFLSALTSACSQQLLSVRAYEEERRYDRAMNRMRHESNRTEAERFPKFDFGRKGNGVA